MDKRFEACINCPAQCELFDAKEKLVGLPLGEKPTTIPEIRRAVSGMLLQVKDKRHCPSEELGRAKVETTNGLNPAALVRDVSIGSRHHVDASEIFFIKKATRYIP